MTLGGGLRDADDDGDDDRDLMRRAQTDLSEFARVYDKYVSVIYGYCRRRLDSDTLAEDATSIIFMKALAAAPGFKPGSGTGTVRSWLFTIAHNAVLDQIRIQARGPSQPLDVAFDLIDGAPGPETAALTRETSREMADALAWLTGDQRRVIELRLAGLTGPEIATVLNISHGAVRSLQRRAVVRMRGALCGADKDAQP